MKPKCFIFSLVVSAAILCLQVGCQKQAAIPEKPHPGLKIPSPEKPKITSKTGELAPEITFEKQAYDFGEVGPGTKKVGKFNFTNTGNGVLTIKNVDSCCGCTTKLDKRQFDPGEGGTLKIECRWSLRPGVIARHIYVHSNDKTRPKVPLAIKAKIVPKVDYEPKRLSLLLDRENAGCPEITLKSLDNKPFSIKQFRSTANCITADIGSPVEATKFVLQPKVNLPNLQKRLNGFVQITLTHPEATSVTIPFSTLPEFKITPPMIIVFNAEPQKSIKRDIWVLNNYGQDFEIESASSQNNIIKLLSREKITNGYRFRVEITPPPAETQQRMFTDVFSVDIKGGQKLKVDCRGFYCRK